MERQNVLAVDFDGCLCTNAYPEIGAPRRAVLEAVRERQRQGWAVILWTCREGELLREAVEACRSWGLAPDAVNENLPGWIAAFGGDPRKVSATEYWDDRALRVDGAHDELNALRARLAEAEAILDDPCHWCDPLEGRTCTGCTRRAPDWRGQNAAKEDEGR